MVGKSIPVDVNLLPDRRGVAAAAAGWADRLASAAARCTPNVAVAPACADAFCEASALASRALRKVAVCLLYLHAAEIKQERQAAPDYAGNCAAAAQPGGAAARSEAAADGCERCW